MKKLCFVFLAIALLITCASCSWKSEDVYGGNDEEQADAVMGEIMDAIKQKNASKLVSVFSESAQENCDLAEDAQRLFEFIRGDISAVSAAAEAGVGADYKKENGKIRKEIQASFCVETTETKYYVALRKCVIDEIDDNNEGVLSVYIIEAANWNNDCVYRADGEWKLGIHIVD